MHDRELKADKCFTRAFGKALYCSEVQPLHTDKSNDVRKWKRERKREMVGCCFPFCYPVWKNKCVDIRVNEEK